MIPRVSYPTLLSQVTQATAGGLISGNSTYSWIIDENILRKEVSLERVGEDSHGRPSKLAMYHPTFEKRIRFSCDTWRPRKDFPPFYLFLHSIYVHNICAIFVHNIPIFVHNILLWFAIVSNLAATSLICRWKANAVEAVAMHRNKLRKITFHWCFF